MNEIGLKPSIQKLQGLLPEDASVSRELLDAVLARSSVEGKIEVGDLLEVLFSAVIDLELKMCKKESAGVPVDQIAIPLTIAGKTYEISPASLRNRSAERIKPKDK